MSDGPPVNRADDPGVVDPPRVPGIEAVRRRWDSLPLLGRVFVGLALIDILVHQLGLLGLPAYLQLSAPVTLVGFLTRLALVLLPAVLLDRRPDAAAATPVLLQGAVVLATTELVSDPALLWLPTIGGLATWAPLHLMLSIATAAGYVLLAFGLRAISRAAPGQGLEGLANLAAAAIAGAALVALAASILGPGQELGDPGLNVEGVIAGFGSAVSAFALAYLARRVIRGAPDVRRPVSATYVGAGAMVLAGLAALVNLVVGLVVLVQLAVGQLPDVAGGPVNAAAIASAVALFLLVVAFALGLGDASGRMAPPDPANAAVPPGGPEPPQWPAPGGEVPVFRPVPAPVEPADGPQPTRRRRRRSKAKPKEQAG